jgi:hypothetical protein
MSSDKIYIKNLEKKYPLNDIVMALKYTYQENIRKCLKDIDESGIFERNYNPIGNIGIFVSSDLKDEKLRDLKLIIDRFNKNCKIYLICGSVADFDGVDGNCNVLLSEVEGQYDKIKNFVLDNKIDSVLYVFEDKVQVVYDLIFIRCLGLRVLFFTPKDYVNSLFYAKSFNTIQWLKMIDVFLAENNNGKAFIEWIGVNSVCWHDADDMLSLMNGDRKELRKNFYIDENLNFVDLLLSHGKRVILDLENDLSSLRDKEKNEKECDIKDNQPISDKKEIVDENKIKLQPSYYKYIKYKIMSCITFGIRRERYQKKYENLKLIYGDGDEE